MQYGSNEYLGLTKSTEATTEIKGLIGSLPDATWLDLPMQGSGRPGSPHTGSFCLVSAPTQPGWTEQLIGCQTTNSSSVLFVSLHKHLGEVARTAPARPRGNDPFLRFPRAWHEGGFCIWPARPPTLPRHPITGFLHPGSLVSSYAANQSGPKCTCDPCSFAREVSRSLVCTHEMSPLLFSFLQAALPLSPCHRFPVPGAATF